MPSRYSFVLKVYWYVREGHRPAPRCPPPPAAAPCAALAALAAPPASTHTPPQPRLPAPLHGRNCLDRGNARVCRCCRLNNAPASRDDHEAAPRLAGQGCRRHCPASGYIRSASALAAVGAAAGGPQASQKAAGVEGCRIAPTCQQHSGLTKFISGRNTSVCGSAPALAACQTAGWRRRRRRRTRRPSRRVCAPAWTACAAATARCAGSAHSRLPFSRLLRRRETRTLVIALCLLCVRLRQLQARLWYTAAGCEVCVRTMPTGIV